MHTLWSITFRKSSKIGATRCKILRLKCTKFDFCLGSTPDPAGGGYSTPPDLLAVCVVQHKLLQTSPEGYRIHHSQVRSRSIEEIAYEHTSLTLYSMFVVLKPLII